MNDGQDGLSPYAAVILDSRGNLYGTTKWGGGYGYGAVFELTPVAAEVNGQWREKVLHSFQNNRSDGILPYSSLVIDATGNLYGTTYGGGTHHSCGAEGCGTVFVLVPGTGGQWIEHVLHSFNILEGYFPEAGLILDSAGNLYGTTAAGGDSGGGMVFEIVR